MTEIVPWIETAWENKPRAPDHFTVRDSRTCSLSLLFVASVHDRVPFLVGPVSNDGQHGGSPARFLMAEGHFFCRFAVVNPGDQSASSPYQQHDRGYRFRRVKPEQSVSSAERPHLSVQCPSVVPAHSAGSALEHSG